MHMYNYAIQLPTAYFSNKAFFSADRAHDSQTGGGSWCQKICESTLICTVHITHGTVLKRVQGVPDHKSYVVLFKYYGGGEVDFFEVASNFGVAGGQQLWSGRQCGRATSAG